MHNPGATPSPLHPPTGLPLPPALAPRTTHARRYYAITTVDPRGRLGDRKTVRRLGWSPRTTISLDIVESQLIVLTRSATGTPLTREGHIRVPAGIRRLCRFTPSTRLLLIAWPARDLLVIYPDAALDSILDRERLFLNLAGTHA